PRGQVPPRARSQQSQQSQRVGSLLSRQATVMSGSLITGGTPQATAVTVVNPAAAKAPSKLLNNSSSSATPALRGGPALASTAQAAGCSGSAPLTAGIAAAVSPLPM